MSVFVLFCFKSYPIGGLKGLCGTKEIQIPSSWTEPPVHPLSELPATEECPEKWTIDIIVKRPRGQIPLPLQDA
jgi:hypothetical protein